MGIPVPENNKHIIYVWLDALTNYLSALNFPDVEDLKYRSFCYRCPYNWKRYFKISCYILASFFIAADLPLPRKSLGTVGFSMIKNV